MLPLASALRAAGHDIRWAVAAEAWPALEAAGFTATPAGLPQAERLAEYYRRYPEARSLRPADRPDHMFHRMFGAVATPPMLVDVLHLVQEWQPQLVVHDAADFAGAIAAAATGVPHVTHGFGLLTPEVRVRRAGDEVAHLWREQGLEARPYGGAYDHMYLDIYPPSMRPAGADTHVPRTQSLRPATAAAVAEDHPQSRPLVYVTFGTVFNDVGSPFADAVAGVARLPVDVLVTIGRNGDPAALGDVPENVRVEHYVPQAEVLPRCAAVVSHGGSGTLLAGLAHGLPQLALPQGADQFLNAAQTAAVGAGVALLPGESGAAEVSDALGRLLGESSYRLAAQAVARDIAAMPGPDEVAVVLGELAGSG